MHKRFGLTLFAGLAIFVAACSGGGGHHGAVGRAPSVAASAPPRRRPRRPSRRRSSRPSRPGVTCDSKLKVGLVTDVGRINDKGFNQSAYEGMQAAAEAAPELLRHRVHRDHQPVRLRGQHRAVHR